MLLFALGSLALGQETKFPYSASRRGTWTWRTITFYLCYSPCSFFNVKVDSLKSYWQRWCFLVRSSPKPGVSVRALLFPAISCHFVPLGFHVQAWIRKIGHASMNTRDTLIPFLLIFLDKHMGKGWGAWMFMALVRLSPLGILLFHLIFPFQHCGIRESDDQQQQRLRGFEPDTVLASCNPSPAFLTGVEESTVKRVD